ncbi:MAG: response regulator [Anaerolineae bacterium]|nr:response regulator [Anaerolineae bacterium]
MDSPKLGVWQKHIRKALNHLHDPDYLRKSPLAAVLGVSRRFDTPAAVRRILVDAITALQPQPDEPPGSRAWEVFQSLHYRYVEQFSQAEVAHQMGVSLRQLRRLQRSALEALVYHLAERYDLQNGASPPDDPPADEWAADAWEDLEWLRTSPPEETTDLSEALPAVVTLLRPLATQRGVSVEVAVARELPGIAAHPTAVRQALLNALTVALLSAGPAPGAVVRVSADALRSQVRITVRWRATETPAPESFSEDQHKIRFAERLAGLCAGSLQVEEQGHRRKAVFTFSVLAQRQVLAIDDNAQALQLLQRYVAGTRYRVVCARDAAEARALIEGNTFEAIVVDVMMPHVDGWTVLADLRQNPLTADTPIVVCTVLPQRELALSLGANGFLQKPFSREAFLQVLDRVVGH